MILEKNIYNESIKNITLDMKYKTFKKKKIIINCKNILIKFGGFT